MRGTGRCVIAATLLMSSLGVAGCAAPGANGGSRVTATPTPATWESGVAPSDVTAIRQSADQTTLTIDLNMPAGLTDHDCWRNLNGHVMDFSATSTIIQVTADFWTDPGCPRATVSVPVTVMLPEPLGTRTVNINSSSLGSYIANPGKTTLRFCYEFRCAPPPPATCDGASIRDAALGADVGAHATWTVRDCDSHWLILDFAWSGGPVCDNTCPSTNMTTMRWFYRATEHGWFAIAGTTAPGCSQVQRAEPAFPTALCQELGRP
jgi:hypothetical protein